MHKKNSVGKYPLYVEQKIKIQIGLQYISNFKQIGSILADLERNKTRSKSNKQTIFKKKIFEKLRLQQKILPYIASIM